MPTDPSTGAESPGFTPVQWDKANEGESFQNFLEANNESVKHKETVTTAAISVAKQLQLALSIPSAEAEKIVQRNMGALTATMNERIQMEGVQVKEKYIALINDPVRGRSSMEGKLQKLNGFTEKDRKSLEGILSHFVVLGDKERGKSYLTRWMNRDATNGRLAQEDYEAFKRIHAPEGSKEKAFLDQLYDNMLELRKMDPENLTFVNSMPRMSNGARFVASLLLGGIALFSLLMARKSGRIPKKGLVALGLLFYIHRNPESKLSFLSSSRYETLTKELRGSKEGTAVIDALGDKRNRTALRDFARRESKRQSLSATQRGGLQNSTDSINELTASLGLGGEKARKLRSMEVADILELSGTLQKFSREELDITGEFVKTGSTRKDIADIEIKEPEGT